MKKKDWIKVPGCKYEVNYDCDKLRSTNFMGHGYTKEINGTKDKNGYIWFMINIDGVRRRLGLHHLVYRTFVDPNYIPSGREYVLDHKDNNTTNNHYTNLQVIKQRLNVVKDKFNKKTSKYPGVCWSKQANKWTSQIRHKNRKIHIGSFIDEYEAYESYKHMLEKLTGIKL